MTEKEYIPREAAKQKLAPAINDPDAIDFWEWQCSEIDDIPAADVRPVVKAQIIAMAAEDKPRWIPVTERLPEQGKRYLVIRFDEVTKTQFIDILWHDAHDLWWNRLYKGHYNVTHWMSLPEPPKEET